jgi:AraC family transcriptional regulator of adaptative response/methylated-DNA-[protein]-cysteine methyltransferase
MTQRKPLAELHQQKITDACRLLETTATVPSLEMLAAQVGVSTWHFHRLFKAATGVTPKAYAHAHRAEQLRAELARQPTITEALLEAGYGSSGRFYEQTDAVLGMTPSAWRAGGIQTDISFALGECSLGSILVAETARGICAILLGDNPEPLLQSLQDRFPRATLHGGDAAFEQRIAQIIGFVEAPAIGLDLPLDIRGTAFQQRVWQALRAIPPGQTVSYSTLAAAIGSPHAVRAVASACAANTLAVAIPCHRVIRRDGSLSGYRWGLERKRELLAREHSESP